MEYGNSNPANNKQSPEANKPIDACSVLSSIRECAKRRLNTLASTPLSTTFGEQSEYAKSPEDGLPISESEFEKRYLALVERLAEKAKRYLTASPNKTDLTRTQRSIEARSHKDASVESTSRPGTDQAVKAAYEEAIRTELLRLASAVDSDPDLNLRAINLALIILNAAEQEEKLAKQLDGPLRKQLDDTADILKRAQEMASDNAFASRYQRLYGVNSHTEITFLIYCDLVYQYNKAVPVLEAYTDYDGTLTVDLTSGAEWKPATETNILIDQIDKDAHLPAYVRLATTEFAGLNQDLQLYSKRLYNRTAHSAELFADAERLCRLLIKCGATHKILTRNVSRVVTNSLSRIDIEPLPAILGTTQISSVNSKPDSILNEWSTKPGTIPITIISDDSDASLTCHIQSEPELREFWPKDLPRLHELAFFATRTPDKHEADKGVEYPLGGSLQENQIPHMENRHTIDKDGKAYGLQGTLRLVKLYEKWRANKVEASEASISSPISRASVYVVGSRVERARATIRTVAFAPEFNFKDAIFPLQDSKVIDGAVNPMYYIGCPGSWYDAKHDAWYVLFKGTDPYFRDKKNDPEEFLERQATSNIFGARIKQNGNTTFWNGEHWEETQQKNAKPVLISSDPAGIARHGLEDARVTQIHQDGIVLITANAIDKDAFRRSLEEEAGDKTVLIRGAHTELFKGSSIIDPTGIQSLGNIGPDHFFKNVVIFPKTIQVNGEECIVLLTRQLPSIQCVEIPTRLFELLHKDEEYRMNFWEQKLNEQNIKRNTIIEPLLPHEGFDNPNNPFGQVASGAPPIEVSFTDAISKEEHRYWLLIYNSVPDFKADENRSPHGRLISAALLDYDNPWSVVARGSHAIIAPRTDQELLELGYKTRYPDIAFATGGDIDRQGNLVIWYTDGDAVVSQATCPAHQVISWLLLHDEKGNLKYKPAGKG